MKRIVGVGEMVVSSDGDDELVTHSLGSCLGVVLYDPEACVGGLLHAMLPAASINPEKARERPTMFVDSGVPALFRACYEAGAEKRRLVVKVAGGAARSESTQDFFAIGGRNVTVLRKLLWKNGVMLAAAEVGGTVPRTLALRMATGEVTIRSNGAVAAL